MEHDNFYLQLVHSARPNWKVSIVDGDVNLYKLGFIDYYPCIVKIDVSLEDMWELDDEINQMEIAAYNFDESLYNKPKCELTDEEEEIIKIQRKYIKNIKSMLHYMEFGVKYQ